MNKLNLYTFYTNTHEILLNDFFIPSFNRTEMFNNFNLHTIKTEQKSNTGSFNSPGFHVTTVDKLDIIINAINSDETFIFADCDVQFFKNIYSDILKNKNFDILAQSDIDSICSGFMVIKSSNKVKKYFENIQKLLMNNPHLYPNDQVCINSNLNSIDYKLLPIDKYYTVGNYNSGIVWTGEEITIPPSILMHHANFTIGVNNKIKLMNLVKTKMYSNNK